MTAEAAPRHGQSSSKFLLFSWLYAFVVIIYITVVVLVLVVIASVSVEGHLL